MASWKLTSHLLALDKAALTAATQAPFLAAAGQGRVPKATLGIWLANDRLYIHAYRHAAGRTLAAVDLPPPPLPPTAPPLADTPETQLVDWLAAALTELRREERFFVDVARRYGLALDLDLDPTAAADVMGEGKGEGDAGVKGPGLVLFERLFAALPRAACADRPVPLPWLEAAVVFWGTERVYLESWTWAKAQQTGGGEGEGEGDADGGALRKEFIPNWSSEGFGAFVGRLAGVLDGGVAQAVRVWGEDARADLVKRAETVWSELLAAEAAFWPDVE